MAGIDKTYTNSYKEYKEFKDWADKQHITFFDGHSVCVGDWVWNCEKEDFDFGEIPIMNTPTWLDVYLIQNCKSRFVIDRMKDVHDFDKLSKIEFPLPISKDYKQNRRISIQPYSKKSAFVHKHPFGGKMYWRMECESFDWRFNNETGIWAHCDMLYPTYSSTAYIRSVNGIVRHLRKQYLPKGLKFKVTGRYIDEDYLITIK